MKKKPPIREVDKLPEEAVLNEVILNKADGYFYMGIETKEDKEHGSSMEETSIRS
ncbi:hypothetical protein LCGC14_2181330 [marine sediment metagenome]|uniref:Uncharacterized protein n=1 Tax=marine sediment metagenome TaxID=412755 RepID=A0A0F9E9E9_9ZZZZ